MPEARPVVIRYRNVVDLVNRVNAVQLVGEESVRLATRVWKKIRDIFAAYATMRQLPRDVKEWHVIGRCNSTVVLASSRHLAPYKPPKYIAYVSKNEVLVIDSGVTGYRRIYVRILRLLARATVVKLD